MCDVTHGGPTLSKGTDFPDASSAFSAVTVEEMSPRSVTAQGGMAQHPHLSELQELKKTG